MNKRRTRSVVFSPLSPPKATPQPLGYLERRGRQPREKSTSRRTCYLGAKYIINTRSSLCLSLAPPLRPSRPFFLSPRVTLSSFKRAHRRNTYRTINPPSLPAAPRRCKCPTVLSSQHARSVKRCARRVPGRVHLSWLDVERAI